MTLAIVTLVSPTNEETLNISTVPSELSLSQQESTAITLTSGESGVSISIFEEALRSVTYSSIRKR